jgi:hypothetical protein
MLFSFSGTLPLADMLYQQLGNWLNADSGQKSIESE